MEELINDIKQKLVDTGNFNWINTWNNQLERMQNEQEYAIQNPSCYVELETLDAHQLLDGYQGMDINVNIHILSEELDASDGSIDEFRSIFGLRDSVVIALDRYKPSQGGYMIKISEQQDYSHTNMYHYIIKYVLHWIDDTTKNTYLVSPIPLTIILNKNIE